jgi:hypothetical protein
VIHITDPIATPCHDVDGRDRPDEIRRRACGELKFTGIAMLSRNLPWTKEDDERLRAFVAQGASVIGAAAALRRTTINVRTHARAIGFPFPSLRVERQLPTTNTGTLPSTRTSDV